VVVGPDGSVTATVADDGVGPGTGQRAGGQGLANIARRAETLGGSVEIGAGADGRGTNVAWVVPGSA
jgi:signal transduction histidine kinase